MNSKNLSFTKEWTLFLDRDGVINHRIPGGYVHQWEDFIFLDGVLEAMPVFDRIFGRIIIVSNQQGIGKGMMTQEELNKIDERMKIEIGNSGGHIDATYYSPHLASENHPDRKPGTGMGMKARTDFPEIDFSKSVMVGDSPSDMEFGKKLGMITVFITEDTDNHENADFVFKSLRTMAQRLTTND